ncbi:hypothetical protein QF030_000217 [Streptomyces rishiriensis]|uniref:Uncharacterized protein n=1 Tax=Streptomyces rishiriensis TaxID=68264 RepID=A0ABU0NG16_STRRH|nr:hypothetical protein [Streptomyces rishiriensis]
MPLPWTPAAATHDRADCPDATATYEQALQSCLLQPPWRPSARRRGASVAAAAAVAPGLVVDEAALVVAKVEVSWSLFHT